MIDWNIEDPELEGVGKESGEWMIIVNSRDYSDICTIVGGSSDSDEEQKEEQ